MKEWAENAASGGGARQGFGIVMADAQCYAFGTEVAPCCMMRANGLKESKKSFETR